MMEALLGEHTLAPDSYMVSLAPSLAILSSHGVRDVGCPKIPRSPCPCRHPAAPVLLKVTEGCLPAHGSVHGLRSTYDVVAEQQENVGAATA